MERKSPGFMLYYSDLRALMDLPDDKIGRLIRSLADDGEDLPPELRALYRIISTKRERDEERYFAMCEANRKKISDYWAQKKGIPLNTTEYHSIPQNTEEYRSIPKVKVKEEVKVEVEPAGHNNKDIEGYTRTREDLIERAYDLKILHGTQYEELLFKQLCDKHGDDVMELALDQMEKNSWTSIAQLREVLG